MLPLEPMERKFTITLPVQKIRKTVRRRQFPLTAAYAFTDYRAQGQTLRTLIVDLGPVPSGKLTPFNAYVALSRSPGRETIRLLRAFDDDLFTAIPDENLELEDRRLEALNRETERAWQLRTERTTMEEEDVNEHTRIDVVSASVSVSSSVE